MVIVDRFKNVLPPSVRLTSCLLRVSVRRKKKTAFKCVAVELYQ